MLISNYANGAFLVLGAVLFAVLALHLGTMALVLWRRARRAATPPNAPTELPFICLLRPVCGLDPFDAETLASSFTLDYPNYEVVFCAADPKDPVIGLVQRLIAGFPDVRARILIGEEKITANPKLNNLQKGWVATQAQWIAMADSNLLLPKSYLRELVATWLDGTGLVTSPPLGDRAEGLWGAVECAFLNTNQARWQLAADALGVGFAQGKTMFWQRETLEAVGGLKALGRKLAEDVTATKVVREAGGKVRLVDAPYAQPIGRRAARAVWDRQLRWARVRRDGFKSLFALEIFNGPALGLVAALGLGLMLGAVLPALIAFLVIWYGSEALFARAMGWGEGLRDIAAYVLRDAMLPALWLITWIRPGFVWRGTVMGAEPRAQKALPKASPPAFEVAGV